MPCDDWTGSARKVSWLLILSAGASLAIMRCADAAASARAFGPCVGAAATAPWGADASAVPTSAAVARPPRCLLLMLSPGSGPRPLRTAGFTEEGGRRRWPPGCRAAVDPVRCGERVVRTLATGSEGVNE